MIEFFEINYDKLQNIWIAVIGQSLNDITANGKSKFVKHNKLKAEKWFDLNCKGFCNVCKFANIDPFFVISQKEKVINENIKQIDFHRIVRNNGYSENTRISMKKMIKKNDKSL